MRIRPRLGRPSSDRIEGAILAELGTDERGIRYERGHGAPATVGKGSSSTWTHSAIDSPSEPVTCQPPGSPPTPVAAISAPVSRRSTPGIARAASRSTARIRACACGERTITAQAPRGSAMSSV